MKKILIVLGTRPEAIKMVPLILRLKHEEQVEVKVCVSAQHRQMLDSVLSEFNIIPDYDLSVMKEAQTLSYITEKILQRINAVFDKYMPDIILVHGDTSTAFATALAAFYRGIRIGHIEAGLRSNDIHSPFPEEFNRRAISLISTLNFAPTLEAAQNLEREGIKRSSIFITGNTVIDTLRLTGKEDPVVTLPKKPFILMTVHRREHSDHDVYKIFNAVRRLCIEYPKISVIYPIHPNPRFCRLSSNILGDVPNIILTEPIKVKKFHSLLRNCHFVLTDSGGIQEEAAFLGKPVLIVRNNTERPEGILCGNLKLVGSDESSIYETMKILLSDKNEYEKSAIPCNCFGDGHASERIIEILKKI